MSDARSTVAVIPARGGSKRIPRKNIRPFLGMPLLERTIGVVRAAGIFDRIVVSTDDAEIAEVAAAAGADTPFRRPSELADDMTPTIPVIRHAVGAIEQRGARAEFICCVYPAAVLAQPSDIREGLRMLRESAWDYVFTATSFPFPIQRALRKRADGGCEMFSPAHQESRSQDLEPAFHDAGQFYWGRRNAWMEGRPLFTARSRMLLVPRYRVQDIDTLEDWERAELICELLQREHCPA